MIWLVGLLGLILGTMFGFFIACILASAKLGEELSEKTEKNNGEKN